MNFDYMYIGPTPSNESCAQVGDPDYARDAKRIPLTQGCFALVDADWFEMLSLVNWQAYGKPGMPRYAMRRHRRNKLYGADSMARLIMDAPCGMIVDHINGDTLDNRRANLRICSAAENAQNRARHRNSSSPYKGVSRNTSSKNWGAHIYVDGRIRHLGSFETAEEAAEAYNSAARESFGAFARLNVIGSREGRVEPPRSVGRGR